MARENCSSRKPTVLTVGPPQVQFGVNRRAGCARANAIAAGTVPGTSHTPDALASSDETSVVMPPWLNTAGSVALERAPGGRRMLRRIARAAAFAGASGAAGEVEFAPGRAGGLTREPDWLAIRVV